MAKNPGSNAEFLALVRAVIAGDEAGVRSLLKSQPALARAAASEKFAWYGEISHYLYGGDTALHMAAAAHRPAIARTLLDSGASVGAVNRRGATPLHYACDGGPPPSARNPNRQAEMVALLVEAGADPNAPDKSGVAPLHRAVRNRSAGAVAALLQRGAQPRLRNGNGSTPLHLAVQTTGKGGSGEPCARESQREIAAALLEAGASTGDKDAAGKTVAQRCRDASLLARSSRQAD